jgi:hypothetical protein
MSPPAQACLDCFEALPDSAKNEVALAILRKSPGLKLIPADDAAFASLSEGSYRKLPRHAIH